MPRNGSGTYSRTNGVNTGSTTWVTDRNAGTKIRADRHDTHDQDIADAITASIAKDGQTTTTAGIPFAVGITMNDGTAGTPAVRWTSDTNSGFYRIGADNVGLSLGGVVSWDYGVSTTTFSYAEDGASAGPTFNLYRNSASPAASDAIGALNFQGEDSAGNTETYAAITATINDPTSTSEDATLLLRNVVAGTLTTQITISSTGVALATPLAVTSGGVGCAAQSSQLAVKIASVDFNSANSDNAITVVLPSGYTRYRPVALIISGASASLTTATCGLFTATGAGGTAIVTGGTAITVSTASEDTNNNMQTFSPNNVNTQSFTDTTLFFRVGTAQGSAATANVTLIYNVAS